MFGAVSAFHAALWFVPRRKAFLDKMTANNPAKLELPLRKYLVSLKKTVDGLKGFFVKEKILELEKEWKN